MKIDAQLTDDALLQLIGERLAAVRLARNLTQLSGFLRVCRVLGLDEQLESLIPLPKPSPMAQLKLQRPTRQRATGRRATKRTPSKPWTWDDSA